MHKVSVMCYSDFACQSGQYLDSHGIVLRDYLSFFFAKSEEISKLACPLVKEEEEINKLMPLGKA